MDSLNTHAPSSDDTDLPTYSESQLQSTVLQSLPRRLGQDGPTNIMDALQQSFGGDPGSRIGELLRANMRHLETLTNAGQLTKGELVLVSRVLHILPDVD